MSEAQGRPREGSSEGSVERSCDPTNRNRIGGGPGRTSRPWTAKSISIKGLGRKSGGCAGKEGTPQGGPLSPLLSNLLLDDLDRELERRGLRFVRYADDCTIHVRSERAGRRVMGSVSRFLTGTLRLSVNGSKSAVARPWARTLLGFSFTSGRMSKRRLAPQAVVRLKTRVRVRALTRRTRGVPLRQMIADLRRYLTGWRAYFGFCETPSVLRGLDSWIRRRLRSVGWTQWKRGTRRYAALRRLGVGRDLAARTAGSPHGPWRLARSPALTYALPKAFLHSLGLPFLAARADA